MFTFTNINDLDHRVKSTSRPTTYLTASTGIYLDACPSARGTVTANRTALCKRRVKPA